MGRMNRLVSPLLGGNIRLHAFLTDLPLAHDTPIDFGLQTFCIRCKECAEACPPRALSFEDEPTWEPQGDWSASGKRVYFEDSRRCCDWVSGQGGYCGACMAVCPWTKPDTPLHKLGRAVAATFPGFSNTMIKLDDAFGFGLIQASNGTRRWWQGENK
jgi:reductive dehalogenase